MGTPCAHMRLTYSEFVRKSTATVTSTQNARINGTYSGFCEWGLSPGSCYCVDHALMSAPSMLKEQSCCPTPQFLVAGQILTGLMCGRHPRESGECAKEVSYALEASAELIRQWQGRSAPTLDYKPPTPTGAARTREALVDRAFVATEQWRRGNPPRF